MREPQPRTIHLEDYTQPAFLIDSIELDIDLRPGDALVVEVSSYQLEDSRSFDPRSACLLR